MPDIFEIASKWWKQILLIVLLSALVSGLVVFLKPRQFLSVSTAVPAPSTLNDKENIFRQNTELLYPSLGGADDLDLVLGTAQLDTVFSNVVEKENLVSYYNIQYAGREGKQKALQLLKGNTRVIRTEHGELAVKAWDRQAAKSADLANGIMEELKAIHLAIRNANNLAILNTLKSELAQKNTLTDSVDVSPLRAASRDHQILNYEKLISEYEVLLKTPLQTLIVVERASPSLKPDKPKRGRTIAAATALGFIFGLLAVIVLERKRTTQ